MALLMALLLRRKKGKKKKSWSNMLPGLLESISDRLPLHDYVNFRGVCKSWRHAPSGRKEITSFDKKYPWLLLYGFDDNAPEKCYMYDFIQPSICTFYFPHFSSNMVVLECKAGWLLARRRRRDDDDDDDDQFFLYSLFTLEKMDLPKHKTYSEQVGSFVVPSSSTAAVTPPRDYLAFIVSRTGESSLEISLCRRGAGRWEVQRISVGNDGRLGTMRAVDCFDCNCVDGRCICPTREQKKRIYISGSKGDGLSYDFVNKRVVGWAQQVTVVNPRMHHTSKHRLRHRQNWKTAFGAEDISISVSAVSDTLGCPYWHRIHAHIIMNTATAEEEEGDQKKQLKMVKAAWVEPMFPKFCKKKKKFKLVKKSY